MTIDFDGIVNRVARVPVGADNYGGLSAKTGICFTPSGRRSTTAARAIVLRNLKIYSPSKIAKRRRSPKTSAATCCPTTARKCWWRQGPGYNSTTRRRRATRRASRFRLPGCLSIAFRRKNGTRFSTKSGGAIATGSTCRTCTATTGSPLREQYKPLLQYVAHRSDLNYVISEMISELTVQHAYIEGGDFHDSAAAAQSVLPGARFEVDQQRAGIASRRSSRAKTKKTSIARR